MFKNANKPLLWTGGIFVISFFLKAYMNVAGHACHRTCFRMLMDLLKPGIGFLNSLYYGLFAVANAAFVVIWIIAIRQKRKDMAKPAILSAVLSAYVFSWFLFHLIGRIPTPRGNAELPTEFMRAELSSIGIGYYLWLAAYLMLTRILFTKAGIALPGMGFSQGARRKAVASEAEVEVEQEEEQEQPPVIIADEDPVTIRIECPHCTQHFTAPETMIGADATCSNCGKSFVVSAGES
jgi:hypothetical protein